MMLFFWRVILFSLLYFCCNLPLYCQTYVYQPQKETGTNEHVLSKIDSRFNADLKSANGTPYKDKRINLYTERHDEIRQKVLDGNFFYSTEINDYVNAVYEEILRGNPTVPAADIQVLVSRDTDPNAISYGEGTIAINLGLLRKLENESQLAFVLCHEISHYMLKHSDKQINSTLTALYSKDTQKELDRIAKSEYGQTSQAIDLLKLLTLSTRKYSRAYEVQADSLGFVLLRNTRYNEGEAITCLNILDHVDDEDTAHAPDVTNIFSFPDYPFHKEWIASDNAGIVMNQEKSAEDKQLEDSLKTHPDCKDRMLFLQPYGVSTGKAIYLQPEEKFKRMVWISQYECVQSSYDNGRLSYCIFQAWTLHDLYPEDSYPVTITMKCMNIIHQAMLDHRANVYVPTPSADFEVPYNNILRMFHNMRSREVATVNYHYMHQYLLQYSDDEFLFAAYQSAMTYADPVAIAEMKERYLKAYPTGKHVNQLK